MMWQFDFSIFCQAARALLQGASPYTVPGFISPLPLAVLFVPFALLGPLGYPSYLALSLYLVYRSSRVFLPALLSFPVAFCLFVGQVDMLIALPVFLCGPAWLFLLVAKPQLAFILPWYLARPTKDLAVAAGLAAALLLTCFVIQPGWVGQWLASLSDYDHASNLNWFFDARALFFMAALLAAFMGARYHAWVAGYLLAPITNIYTASIFAPWLSWKGCALTWIAILLVGDIHHGAPMIGII